MNPLIPQITQIRIASDQSADATIESRNLTQLPFPSLGHLTNPAQDEVSLERAEMRDEQPPIEVFGLMAEGPG